MKVLCGQCRKPLDRWPVMVKRHKVFFCNSSCQALYRLGKKRDKSIGLKISVAKKANPTRYWLRKKRYPETIEKMRQAMLGRVYPNRNKTKNHTYLVWLKNENGRRKRSAPGTHSFQQWLELKKLYKNTCPCCLRKEPEIKLTEDHIVPLSLGGSNGIENIQPLCKSCNSKKHTNSTKYPCP